MKLQNIVALVMIINMLLIVHFVSASDDENLYYSSPISSDFSANDILTALTGTDCQEYYNSSVTPIQTDSNYVTSAILFAATSEPTGDCLSGLGSIQAISETCLSSCSTTASNGCPCYLTFSHLILHKMSVRKEYQYLGPDASECFSRGTEACPSQPSDWPCTGNAQPHMLGWGIDNSNNSTEMYMAFTTGDCTPKQYESWNQYNATTTAKSTFTEWKTNLTSLSSCYNQTSETWQSCLECPQIPCSSECYSNSTCIFGKCVVESGQDLGVCTSSSSLISMSVFVIAVIATLLSLMM